MCRQIKKLPTGSTAACLLVLIAVVGCSQTKYKNLKAFVQAHDHEEVASIYRVETPDVISIHSPTCPEVNGTMAALNLDGKINLNLIGSVKVSGLTPKEIATKLEEQLSVYYHHPEVKVRVKEHISKRIYIMGQVATKGPRPFTGRDTVLDVLAECQPTFLAWRSQIKVIRPSPNPEEVKEITIDIDKMIQEGDLRGNFLLQEGDVVYVPPTPMGWLGLRVQEALFPFNPVLSAAEMPVETKWTYDRYKYWDEDRYYGRGQHRHRGAASYLRR